MELAAHTFVIEGNKSRGIVGFVLTKTSLGGVSPKEWGRCTTPDFNKFPQITPRTNPNQ